MEKKQLLKQTADMRKAMAQASRIADELKESLHSGEEPAISAMCNVIRSLLWETEKQERLLTDMLSSKLQD